MWSRLIDSLARKRVRKEKNYNFAILGGHDLNHVVEVNINGAMSDWYHVPLIWCNQDTSPLWCSSPKPVIPIQSWKTPEKSELKEFYKTQGQFSLKLSVMENKEKLINCRRVEQANEMWQLNAMVYPELDPRREKGYLWKKW